MKRWHIAIIVLLGVLLTAWWLLRDNFHAVIPGEVYRSAQLSGAKLAEVVAEHDIQTVISLQRPEPGERWYQDEVAAAASAGAEHHDIGLDLTFSPRIDHLLELRDLLQNAPRPLLFHCEAGADRTGLAAVMTRLLDGESTLEEARAQVGLKYHAVRDDSLGIPFFNAYALWLESNSKDHSTANFNHWLENEYADLSGNIHFLVDPIRGQTWWRPWGRIAQGVQFEVSRAESPVLELTGWAFDTRNGSLLEHVAVRLGDIAFDDAQYGIPQPWLIDDFGKDAWIDSGWRAALPLAKVPDGCHELFLEFTRLDGSTWTSPPAGRVCVS